METAQSRPANRHYFDFPNAALIDVFLALQDSHGAIFASKFVSEYSSAIERAAKRLDAAKRLEAQLLFPGS